MYAAFVKEVVSGNFINKAIKVYINVAIFIFKKVYFHKFLKHK